MTTTPNQPDRIWLSPICDDSDDRTWAAPAPEAACEDCGEPWVEYVRADLSTPATPLLDDETVERCAEVAEILAGNDSNPHSRETARQIATAIRALKGSTRGLR